MNAASEFKAGDPPPSGYVAWHEWARVQHRAGLRQTQCACCKRWLFPQERHSPDQPEIQQPPAQPAKDRR